MTTTMTVMTEVSEKRIADLLCCGFEGGVGYWCRIYDYVTPSAPVAHMPSLNGSASEIFPHFDYPLCEGGAVLCYETEELTDRDVKRDPSKLLRLDRAAIARGLQLMSTVAPRHWGDFLAENEDATTGDVFIQLCLLGEVRYG